MLKESSFVGKVRPMNIQTTETIEIQQKLQLLKTKLALLEGIARAIGEKWEMQVIYDYVGEHLSRIFEAQSVIIAVYDEKTGLGSFPFILENGHRVYPDPLPMKDISVGQKLLNDPTPLKINTAGEMKELGSNIIAGTESTQSGIFVPLLAGDIVYGGLSLQSLEREYAFSDADLKLLVTIAGSISQALENARLYEEARQRNAELALINSVQQGLAAELNMQAIYDLVGDKIRHIFNAQVVLISVYNLEEQTTTTPYMYEKGERYFLQESELSSGLCLHFQQSPKTLLINENIDEATKKYNFKVRLGEKPKSLVFVPLVVGQEVTGHISLQNIDRENAFSDSDVRLLETLAAGMSVALQNAQLLAETQRLLKETQQRNAELALINSIQQGLVAKMDMNSIYELVGDQIRDIFDAQVVTINRYDTEEQSNYYCYAYEKGQRFEIDPQPLTPILQNFIENGRHLLLNKQAGQTLGAGGGKVVAGETPRSFLAVPLWSGKQVTGSISLQNVDREDAFDDDQVRLLSTVAASTSVALENARLFGMIKRRAKEMAVLAEVGRDISATLDLQTLLERIAIHARDLLNVKDSAVYLPDETGSFMTGYTALGPIAEQVKASVVKPGEGILGEIWLMKEPEIINAAQNDPRAVLIDGTQKQVDEKMMVTPLFSGEKVIGLMAVWRIGGNNFKETELEFFVGLSRQAAIAIENARLYSQAERARAAAEDANRTKSAFLANVSHELRTPLTSILGFAHVLQNRLEQHVAPVVPSDDQEAKQALNQIDNSLAIILSEGQRLTTLINNVLDLEKIEAGEMDWQMETVNLVEIMEQGIDATSSLIEQRGLKLERDIVDKIPLVQGDHDKLVQVIVNLLSNAAKFTDEGSITCRIQCWEWAVIVSIQDTGAGIPAEELDNVFEKFSQVGDTLTGKPRGTGLGLSISKEIVERHGGRIWAESKCREGSTFSFILPADKHASPGSITNATLDALLVQLK